jgi:hypothetical protein
MSQNKVKENTDIEISGGHKAISRQRLAVAARIYRSAFLPFNAELTTGEGYQDVAVAPGMALLHLLQHNY